MSTASETKQVISTLKAEVRSCNRELRELRKTNDKLSKKVAKIKPPKQRAPTEHNMRISEIMKRAAVSGLPPKQRLTKANEILKAEKAATK
jgi:chorismate mutase